MPLVKEFTGPPLRLPEARTEAATEWIRQCNWGKMTDRELKLYRWAYEHGFCDGWRDGCLNHEQGR